MKLIEPLVPLSGEWIFPDPGQWWSGAAVHAPLICAQLREKQSMYGGLHMSYPSSYWWVTDRGILDPAFATLHESQLVGR